MELGSARFSGAYYNCGKVGHRAVDCRLPRRQVASQPTANRPTKIKANLKVVKASLIMHVWLRVICNCWFCRSPVV